MPVLRLIPSVRAGHFESSWQPASECHVRRRPRLLSLAMLPLAVPAYASVVRVTARAGASPGVVQSRNLERHLNHCFRDSCVCQCEWGPPGAGDSESGLTAGAAGRRAPRPGQATRPHTRTKAITGTGIGWTRRRYGLRLRVGAHTHTQERWRRSTRSFSINGSI